MDTAPSREPLVAVIIPTRDYAAFLPRAVESVLAQTLPDWRCTIVDDGSTDDTPAVIAGFVARDPRISTLRLEGVGVSAARNAGLAATPGRLVQFLDADDWIAAEKLAVQAATLDANPEVDVVYGNERRVIDGIPVEMEVVGGTRPSGAGAAMTGALLVRNRMVVSAPLFRRSLFERFGGFDETRPLNEDLDLLLRFALGGATFAYEPDARSLSFIRIHPASASRNRVAMIRSAQGLRRALRPRIDDPALVAILDREVHQLEADLAAEYLKEGRSLRGWATYLALAIRTGEPHWFTDRAEERWRPALRGVKRRLRRVRDAVRRQA